jgi:glycolate oxidase FAD binding subunit
MTPSLAIADKFESLVGAANVRTATAKDAVAGQLPELVVSPGTEQELAAVLAFANEAGVAVVPRGGGTKIEWGNPVKRAEVVLSTLRLNRVLEHAWADLTVTVEAGCTLQTLQDAVSEHGQRLALDALWPKRATVGGVLSSNDSGVFRLRFGALRDLIIGVTLALPDGTLASSGGKVVKNVAGYDLPKLATGALGTLGVITRAVFRLHPLPWAAGTITCVAADIAQGQRFMALLLNSNLAYSALQARFVAAKEREILIDVLFEGTDSGRAAQIARVQSLADPLPLTDTNATVWQTREALHSEGARCATTSAQVTISALLKISALPGDAIKAMGDLSTISAGRAKFDAVVQATGLGTVLLTADPAHMGAILKGFRERMEKTGGSMVILGGAALDVDAWGDPGDAIGVMRALKKQLDPKNTLNPGRFVGGI